VKASQFGYHRPGSVDEAVEMLARYGSAAQVLAGGQSLMPLLALRRARPEHLVDVQQVGELAGIWRAHGLIRFGAMVRHRDVQRDGAVPPLMRFAARYVGNIEVRNRGTLGGSLAFADPAAEWPAVALAMEAVLVAVSVRGRREIAAQDFLSGAYVTSLAADELLAEVLVPEPGTGFGFVEAARRGPGDFALAGAVCCGEAVVVFGAGDRPQRLPVVEEAAGSGESADGLAEIAAAEIEATSEYRRRLAAGLVVRAVNEARERG
jgi:CO/xanthine dehydrogenase FAD-binding subunit